MGISVKFVKDSFTVVDAAIASVAALAIGYSGYEFYKWKKTKKEEKARREALEKKKREFISANKLDEQIVICSIRNPNLRSGDDRARALKILRKDLAILRSTLTEEAFEDAKIQLDIDCRLFRDGSKDDIFAMLCRAVKDEEEQKERAEQARIDLQAERDFKIQMNQVELVRKENEKDRENSLEQVRLITSAIKSASEGSKSPNTININNGKKDD